MNRAVLFGLLCLLAGVLPRSAFAADPSAIFSQNQGALVFVKVTATRADNSQASETGTGFVVSDAGFILTNNHLFSVLHPGDTALVVFGSMGSRYRPVEELDVIERNPQLDLALLRFKDTSRKRQPVMLGEPEKVLPGHSLYLMGFPEGLDASIATGNLSGLAGPGGTWQTTLPANRGNSGGPVFDADGRVIAVLQADLGPKVSGISFVVPINLARSILLMVPGTSALPSSDVRSVERTTAQRSCRIPENGVERYATEVNLPTTSPERSGGGSQPEWCNTAISLLRAQIPQGEFSVIDSSERSRSGCAPFNCPLYTYSCTVHVKSNPIYAEKISPSCP